MHSIHERLYNCDSSTFFLFLSHNEIIELHSLLYKQKYTTTFQVLERYLIASRKIEWNVRTDCNVWWARKRYASSPYMKKGAGRKGLGEDANKVFADNRIVNVLPSLSIYFQRIGYLSAVKKKKTRLYYRVSLHSRYQFHHLTGNLTKATWISFSFHKAQIHKALGRELEK